MTRTHRIKVGIQAGLLGGASIVVFFLLMDLIHLRPLGTPLALGSHLFGPSSLFQDTPALSRAWSITVVAGNLITLTILHFLAFSLLGVCAVWWFGECGIRGNIATGALFGLLFGSFVFYTCVALGGSHVLANFPGPWTVTLANLTAGAVMGGVIQNSHSRSS